MSNCIFYVLFLLHVCSSAYQRTRCLVSVSVTYITVLTNHCAVCILINIVSTNHHAPSIMHAFDWMVDLLIVIKLSDTVTKYHLH